MPLNFFQWTNLNGKASHLYISARCYTTAGLCRWFGGMDKMLLPLCAVLSGNDYGVPKGVEILLQLLDINARKVGGKGIESILIWLSSFSNPKEALDEVSRLMKNYVNIHRLKSELWTGMQEYCITPHSPLALWFSESRVIPSEWISKVPACFSQVGAEGMLPPMVVDTVVMNRVILIPQVENSKLASSHNCAKVLRQAVYGLLLRRKHETQGLNVQENISQGTRGATGKSGRGKGSDRSRGGRDQGTSVPTQPGVNAAASAAPVQVARGTSVPVCVEEYDRMELNFKKNQVETQLPRSPVHLDTLNQVNNIINKNFTSLENLKSVIFSSFFI